MNGYANFTWSILEYFAPMIQLSSDVKSTHIEKGWDRTVWSQRSNGRTSVGIGWENWNRGTPFNCYFAAKITYPI